MFQSVLIANRGEIAVRIIRTLRDMGIRSIAAFSDADRDALFVQEADEAFRLGPAVPAESYLNIDAILACAAESGAQAIHPGYGFLAENVAFAAAVEASGLTFIGPPVEAIRRMGDKVEARAAARASGVPVVPGTAGSVAGLQEALQFASSAGYPVAVKAAGGGGGRGIRVVGADGEMEAALAGARREAQAYFGNPEVYLERYYNDPKHIEFQILGDKSGGLVHLGERDCSIQRRHQKLIEETPSPAVDRSLRQRMGEAALKIASSVNYFSAGTVEFLLTRDGEYYFLEMNTRIQVEHPVTELVTGVDLIAEMIHIAAGEPMSVQSSILDPRGHAIEVRVNAENPNEGFRPTPVAITGYREPGGIGIRVDTGVYQGFTIPSEYDSLMTKVIAWAPDRQGSLARISRALHDFRIHGPSSTIEFSSAILRTRQFVAGDAGTQFVESHMDELRRQEVHCAPSQPAVVPVHREPERTFEVEVNRKHFRVRVAELRSEPARSGARPRGDRSHPAPRSGDVVSPMHGTIVSVLKHEGDTVMPGEALFVVEAMKMENEIVAHREGTLTGIEVAAGDTVEAEQKLARIE